MSIPAKLLTGFFKGMSRLSLRQAQAVGAAVGGLLAVLPERWSHPKRVTRLNLEVAFPELSHAERQALVKQSLIELGKTAAELGPVWLKPVEEVKSWLQPPQNQHLLEEALAKGKGVMLLMPHLGMWEILSVALADYGQITYLYRPPNLAEMEDFMVTARERQGAKLVPTDVKGVRALTKALKQNQMVGILPDQDPGERGGVYAPFFGRPARTMTLVGRLAHKTGCAVLMVAAKRLPKGQGFQMVWQPAESAISDADELTAATALNQSVEQLVRQFPEQYQWEYKRYRHPPERGEDIYKGVKK